MGGVGGVSVQACERNFCCVSGHVVKFWEILEHPSVLHGDYPDALAADEVRERVLSRVGGVFQASLNSNLQLIQAPRDVDPGR